MDTCYRDIRFVAYILGITLISALNAASAADVTVGDAYARSEESGQRWTIGTGSVEQVFECREGQFHLASYLNKLTQPAAEYVLPETAAAPFGLEAASFAGPYHLEEIWSKTINPQSTANPAADKVSLKVEKGDRIGFCALAAQDAVWNTVEWATSVNYANGQSYVSTEDTALNQGPVWFYCHYATGTGCLEELGEISTIDLGKGAVSVRVAAGYRAPFETHGISNSAFALRNSYTLMRVWQAPESGVITLDGEAAISNGQAAVRIVRIKEKAGQVSRLSHPFSSWKVEKAGVSRVNAGGRPAVQLEILLSRPSLQASLRVIAYPGTPILRQWVTLQNTGEKNVILDSPLPFLMSMKGAEASSYSHYWLCGGTSRPNQGVLQKAAMSESYHHSLLGERSDNLVPWIALHRNDSPADGCFATIDYLGTWNISLDQDAGGPTLLSMSLPSLADYPLAPGERLDLPVVTTGVFHQNLDNMGVHLYNWQYEYMWDYTNPDYYALTKWPVAWFACSRNLQEQFTARLAHLDMDADLLREMGFDMLWDDAGWAKYPGWPVPDSYSSVFQASYEGPDYANTLRYLNKMDMKWLIWFVGRPSLGIMGTKIASWGNFQWRTDGFGRSDLQSDRAFRTNTEQFLNRFPQASFHTCCGGSRYAHQFEIQRLADVNYLSDMGRGPEVNYYFSYLETPDKWLDGIEVLINGCKYNQDTSRQLLCLAPLWSFRADSPEERQMLRLDNQIYHFLLSEGVAGRWSYVFHPAVSGDDPMYYFQRTSYDRTKACIILRHRSPNPVTIRPGGLLADHSYIVGFDSTSQTTTRTGADLMENGIGIEQQKPGELIYLGLPNRPGHGMDTTPPQAPGFAVKRFDANIGHSGIGIYWSAGCDDTWVSYYEVKRNDQVLGKVSKGNYYFDHAEGWNLENNYVVRTVDGDGNQSQWIPAVSLPGKPTSFHALGGHFPAAGRDGWSAETTTDGQTFAPMTWVPPARNPGGDLGGTPNQPGGVEGYWEGAGTARVGRGWQQASPQAVCVRSWTAHDPGPIRVLGRAAKEYFRQTLGTAQRVKIMLNQQTIWPDSGAWADVPLNDLAGAAHDLHLTVHTGDVLRFMVDRSEDPDNAIMAWMPQIIYENQSPKKQTGSVVRILCGSDKDYVDQIGNHWSADRYYTGGKTYAAAAEIQNAAPTEKDQPLYQQGRCGKDFTYAIPIQPGLYAIRLKFTEPEFEWSFQRPFHLDINGARVLTNYDICWRAKGPRRAYEKVFHNLVPDKNGQLVLRFTNGLEPVSGAKGDALVQAMEIVPENNTAIRVNAGSNKPWIDWNSQAWLADTEHPATEVLVSAQPLSQATPTLYDQGIYQTAVSGREIRYQFPAEPGLYAVHLKFAELWLDQPGQRTMDIKINGRTCWSDWDPATAAEQLALAADLRVENIVPDHLGHINIIIQATGENNAILQGLEIE